MAFFLVQEAEMSLCHLWGTPCEGGLPEGVTFGPPFVARAGQNDPF